MNCRLSYQEKWPHHKDQARKNDFFLRMGHYGLDRALIGQMMNQYRLTNVEIEELLHISREYPGRVSLESLCALTALRIDSGRFGDVHGICDWYLRSYQGRITLDNFGRLVLLKWHAKRRHGKTSLAEYLDMIVQIARQQTCPRWWMFWKSSEMTEDQCIEWWWNDVEERLRRINRMFPSALPASSPLHQGECRA